MGAGGGGRGLYLPERVSSSQSNHSDTLNRFDNVFQNPHKARGGAGAGGGGYGGDIDPNSPRADLLRAQQRGGGRNSGGGSTEGRGGDGGGAINRAAQYGAQSEYPHQRSIALGRNGFARASAGQAGGRRSGGAMMTRGREGGTGR